MRPRKTSQTSQMSMIDSGHGPNPVNQPGQAGTGVSGITDSLASSVSQSSFSPPVKSLPYSELLWVCQSLGGTPGRTLDNTIMNPTGATKISSNVDEKNPSVGTQQDDEEKQLKFSPTVPPPTGLYKRVIDKRKTAWWKFQVLAVIYNICILLQLLLGATLTALGASDKKRSAAITIIAALNSKPLLDNLFPRFVRRGVLLGAWGICRSCK